MSENGVRHPEFERIRKSLPRARGHCPRCGTKYEQAAGTVRLGLNEYVPEKHNAVSVSTRAVAFCESCCVAVYTELENALLEAGSKAPIA